MTTIPIIGSGTIGSYTSYLLQKRGIQTTLYEEHSSVGEPCHCTGILTHGLQDIITLKKDIVINKLKQVKVVSPNNSSTILKTNDIVLDRIGLDVYFTKLATDKGAELKTNHKFLELKKTSSKDSTLKHNTAIFKHKNKTKTVKFNKLIGADGPNSKVYPLINPTLQRQKWFGVQAVIKGEFQKEMYEVYLGNEICPKFFAWCVPKSETESIIGLATKEQPHKYFDRFMKQRIGKEYKKEILSFRGGLIPHYNPKVKCQKDNLFIVGDAAGHVKATTGGGIIPGMKAAQALAQSLDPNTPAKSYDKLWRRHTGRNLWMHLTIRHMLDNCSDSDYNFLIELMEKKYPKEIMAGHDREYPSSFAIKMALKEPRFLYFIKHLF